MTSRPGAGLIHVVGRAEPGDPVTASARGICRTLAQLGRPGRLVAAERAPGMADVAPLEGATEPAAIVHSVDGGDSLLDALPTLVSRRLTLVHHGSSPGSDRRVLRSLRAGVTHAVGADACAREELRALGFGPVGTLDPGVVDAALDGLAADAGTAAQLASHPGPMILAAGPLAPGRSLELLLDAFADLLTTSRPSATLSLCGPSSPWYLATLRRRILARGLLACELGVPGSEAEVVARLDQAHALVSLRPAVLDPYLRSAARRGLPIVVPHGATAAELGDAALTLSGPPTRASLTAALERATAPRKAPVAGTSAGARSEPDRRALRALAIR